MCHFHVNATACSWKHVEYVPVLCKCYSVEALQLCFLRFTHFLLIIGGKGQEETSHRQGGVLFIHMSDEAHPMHNLILTCKECFSLTGHSLHACLVIGSLGA